jgi:hypothetical protein
MVEREHITRVLLSASSLTISIREQLAQQLSCPPRSVGTIAQHYLALVHFACAMIAYRAATRRNGHMF